MTHQGAQESSPRVLDFRPSTVDSDGMEVAQKMVPAGTVLH